MGVILSVGNDIMVIGGYTSGSRYVTIAHEL